MINIIVAISKNGIIGSGNDLPWHISEDLKYFKQITSGKSVLMGRKTFESIGKPLPNRKNVVVTRNEGFNADGVLIFHSLEEALSFLKDDEIFIIGGASIYEQSMSFADRLYVTFIDKDFKGDVKFPDINGEEWNLDSENELISSKGVKLKFRVYLRRK